MKSKLMMMMIVIKIITINQIELGRERRESVPLDFNRINTEIKFYAGHKIRTFVSTATMSGSIT